MQAHNTPHFIEVLKRYSGFEGAGPKAPLLSDPDLAIGAITGATTGTAETSDGSPGCAGWAGGGAY